jgi:hypothetical protein
MIERIAYERLTTGKDSNGAAAAESATNLLLGKYQFEGQLRLPAAANPGLIKRGLTSRLEGVVLPKLAAGDIPDDITRAYPAAEALGQWRELVSNNAVWYTAPDDKSAQLWARGQDGVLYRVKQGGRQVSFAFEDLTLAANELQPHNRGQAAQRRFREQLARGTEQVRQQVEAEDLATATQKGPR